MDEKDKIIINLKNENEQLKTELEEVKEHLKKYTAPARNRNRYNPEKAKEYQAKVSQEQKKQYARQAYLNKKERLKKQESENI